MEEAVASVMRVLRSIHDRLGVTVPDPLQVRPSAQAEPLQVVGGAVPRGCAITCRGLGAVSWGCAPA